MKKREYLIGKEVEWLLRLSKDAAARMANRGELPAYRIGRNWRYDIKEIRAACANNYPRNGGASTSS